MNQANQKSNNILTEANDRNTPPQRLEEIYQNNQPKKIKRALASNPNTPLDVLISLSEHFSTSLLENPFFNSHLLSDDNFLLKIPKKTIINILKLSQVPEKFISFALNNYPETEILATIIKHHNSSWNEWIKTNGNLTGANLNDADFSGISFIHGNLSGASLNNSNLSGAYLIQAKLNGASLSDADLSNAYLNDASLVSAKLIKANLKNANLSCADLRSADLRNADLGKANLEDANFRDCNLKGANFKGANLKGVKINSGTKVDNIAKFESLIG